MSETETPTHFSGSNCLPYNNFLSLQGGELTQIRIF